MNALHLAETTDGESTAIDCNRLHSTAIGRNHSKFKRWAAFTLIELLIVISIIAIVATLAVGAAVKAIHQGKVKRIATTALTLKMAIMNYRSQRGNWPFVRPGGKSNGDFSGKGNVRTLKGGADSRAGDVWAKLYKDSYIDGSGILCYYKGEIKALNTVSRREASGGIQLGFRDPDESTRFLYYNIKFNTATESVRVTYSYSSKASEKAGGGGTEDDDEDEDDEEEDKE